MSSATVPSTTPMDIVAVQFQDRKNPEFYTSREYTYYSDIPLKVGEIVAVSTKRGVGKARVARIGLTPAELIPGIDYKTIEAKAGDLAQHALDEKDKAILETWDRFDGPDISTEQLLARVEDETGYDADVIINTLYRHRNTSNKKEEVNENVN